MEWTGDAGVTVGYALGTDDGDLYRKTLRAVSPAKWGEVLEKLSWYLSPAYGGHVPRRQAKFEALKAERLRRAADPN